MAPSTTPIPPPVIPPHPKTKRPVPAGIQTNGLASSSSPSPSMSAKKAPNSAKALAKSAAASGGTVTVARPNNQIRSEITALPNGNVRSSISAAAQPAPSSAIEQAAVPVVVEQPPSRKYILKKYVGNPPSLIVHLHPTHWKFDSQDDYFLYTSPMKTFLEHLRARTIPHDMMAELTEDEVPFYEGCLIVEVHDHRTAAVAEKDEARPSSRSKEDAKNSIHKYNRFITPSPNKPFPKDVALANGLGKKSDTNQQEKRADSAEQGGSSASSSPQGQKNKTPVKTRISTLVLFPTQQSRQADLALKACNPRGSADGTANGVPPTPSAVPPTPTGTGSSMPPPAKRVKRERMELDSANIREAEGAMLVATLPPLDLEPTRDARGTIAKLEAQAEALKHRFLPAPKPVTRKRTVAEMAADEAQAAGHERYLLTLDDRNGQGGMSVPGGDGQQQQQHFDPDFGRFKKIEEIKREHLERATQEKLQQAEKERALQDRKQQQQQQQQQAQAQAQAQLLQQQAEERNRQDQEQQRAQLQAQQETLRRRQQMMAQQQAQQRQQQQALAMGQNAHGHPVPNGQVNGGPGNLPVSAPSGMAMAGARLQAAASQPPASSPMVRQNTPQNMSSPMVGAVAMQASNSSIGAGSPARPPSVVNQPPMSAPMAVSMSARGSQQSHPSGTPRMPNATPNMAHATPISRAQQLANTPRMTQASPPPNMMAPQMQPGMMNNASNAAAHAQMVAASQRNIQQANMFNNGGMNLTPQQQQQRLMMQAAAQQQQARMQQQLQQNPQLAQNPQLMQQFLMQQQRQQAQAFAQQQAQQGARQNMGNMQSGVQFPSQQAAAMYQMQQQQQLQQLAAQQQAGQSQQQQMQAQQRMGQPGQQMPAHMQNNLMMHFQRLYTQNLPKWLQARGYASPEVVPPQELEAFKRQCNNAARQQMMQVMARQQNAQQMSPQQQQQQQQQQQLMFQQQRMQAMQAQAQAQAMHQQQMHMMSQQGL
ncbi:hypothetical protein N0V82_009333 [Gnomoniopsis sp. IMI 355080]|nr:hypothetical protein N0V82_009333 [Gnomoniopsis sp. IMI 355080]